MSSNSDNLKDASTAAVINSAKAPITETLSTSPKSGPISNNKRPQSKADRSSSASKASRDAVKPWWLTTQKNFLGRLGQHQDMMMDSRRTSAATSAVPQSPHHIITPQGATIVHGSSVAPGRRFKLPRSAHDVIPDARLTAREFVYLLSGFVLLFLAASVTARDLSIMVNLLAFIYPAFFSIRALESMRPRELEKWLTYWVVFAFVNIGELFSDNLLWWFPYYWFMKSTFMVWCFLPIENNGSFYMYDNMIRPAYNSNGDEFEAMIDAVKHNFLKFYNTVKDKTGDFAKRLSREENERAEARSRIESSSHTSNKASPASKGIYASSSQGTKPPSSNLDKQGSNSGTTSHRPGAGSSANPRIISNQDSALDKTPIEIDHGAGGPGTVDAGSVTENRVLYLSPLKDGGVDQSGNLVPGSVASRAQEPGIDENKTRVIEDPIDRVIRDWQESPAGGSRPRA
ncbi:unnamed protein product [Notodromas monacha]|uniref:Receptor expression-enhancing protein n=1 Tax=Notodromas monacha TaxID=399045 RepID=A0A7R9BVG4_9CRUS|nr:unnamed protein product [Notodromas monacha]CAG0920871.1 unnamed protein product [Notodromas monacha]